MASADSGRRSILRKRSSPIIAMKKLASVIPHTVTLPTGEKYKPTGDFEKDFVELCSLVGIQSLCVVARPKRPATPSASPCNTSMGKGKNAHQQQQPVEPPKTIGEGEDAPPTTFIIAKNKYEYFKPRVEIETEEESNRVFVKELFVRGWRVDQKIIDVLTITMPELERLTVVDLWNAGLTDETMATLGQCLSSSTSLKTLRLDGNSHASSQRFDVFLSDRSLVQNMSLKNCCLTDIGAMHIGNCLRDNKNLLTLNLCFNNINNQGAAYLAKGLRLNRTLLSLNLGSNNISDEGAKHISEVLTTFCLTHEEVVLRRQLKSTFMNEEGSASPTHTSSQERPPTATRSFSKDEKRNNKNKDKKKDSSNNKLKDNGVKRGPSNADTSKHQKTPKGKVSQKQDRNKTPQLDTEDVIEFKNPLLENTREENGELWIQGNKALINLNLARNKIGEKGLEHLYKAVKYQSENFVEPYRSIRAGLMRLSLQRNDFPSAHSVYVQLNDIMKTRDPFYEPPTPSVIEENPKEES